MDAHLCLDIETPRRRHGHLDYCRWGVNLSFISKSQVTLQLQTGHHQSIAIYSAHLGQASPVRTAKVTKLHLTPEI